MLAPVGHNPSLTWRSLVWGRDLFAKGIRWKVGNGRSICIDQDPWINRRSSRSPLFTPEYLKGAKVANLLNENNQWDEELIRGVFWPGDATIF